MKPNLIALISVTLLGVVAAASANAQIRPAGDAPPEAISRYMVGTRLGYITCSDKYRDYVGKWEKFSFANEGQTTVTGSPPDEVDYRGCVQETLVKGRNLYGGAAKSATAPSSKAALKDYQTTWEASLTSLGRPGGGEKPLEFRARQSKAQTRLDELQRKVEAQPK